MQSEQSCSICNKSKAEVFCDIYQIDSDIRYTERVHLCKGCLEITKGSFIFFCVSCGVAHIRDKTEVITSMSRAQTEEGDEFADWLRAIADKQSIVGINSCISCDREMLLTHCFDFSKRTGTA